MCLGVCVFGCVVGATKCAWVNHPVFAVKIKWQTNVASYGGGGTSNAYATCGFASRTSNP